MLYLDGRQGLSEFVLRCLKLSGWDEILQPLIEFPLFSYYQVTRQKENIFGKIFVMFLQVIT